MSRFRPICYSVVAVLSVASLVVGCASEADNAAAPKVDEQVSPEWRKVITAAQDEGEVVWSTFKTSAVTDKLAEAFSDKYGIEVTVSVTETGAFLGKLESELAAGKQSADIRTGGPVPRILSSRGANQPLGHLPVMDEPESVWSVNPFQDIRSGKGENVQYAVTPYFLVANNELCPKDDCPDSYKALADPKWADLKILLHDPTGPSAGLRWIALTAKEYGKDYVVNALKNVDALTDNSSQAQLQVARGEYALYLQSPADAKALKLPEPRPFRYITPADGQMVFPTGASLLKGAPHPNAGKLLINFLLSKEGQAIMAAGVPGEAIVRTDVKPVKPELVKVGELFPGGFMDFEFAISYTDYHTFSDPILERMGLK